MIPTLVLGFVEGIEVVEGVRKGKHAQAGQCTVSLKVT